MHGMQKDLKTESDLETRGITLHKASQYDIHTSLMGLGVNGSNSKMVVEMARLKPGDKVLDVGCGTGNLTLTAKHSVGATGSVYGIDASPEMIAEARKKATRSRVDATFEAGLIERLPYADATFDVVISRLVIHHLPDDLKRRGIAEIFRVLKPGGRLFLADFNPPSNPILAHLTLALVGHRMMQSNTRSLPPLLKELGFVEVASGPTRSAFLGFVSGRKPA
jgi:demethylmenaquinone methyltransferase/2-methoxy-6-polyprenyl-1,4-benzoquinol methylase/phosphoethanolamine N-methyltransferase